ncbi:hypothetical protein Droror1_Dr00014287 [Drosera rotundifolia]
MAFGFTHLLSFHCEPKSTGCPKEQDHGRDEEREKKGTMKVVEVEDGGIRRGFQMPVHYPRCTREDYETMEEWKVDRLLAEYGLEHMIKGSLEEKRKFAIGAFLWE